MCFFYFYQKVVNFLKQKMELRSVGVEFEAVNDDALMIEGKVNGLDLSKKLIKVLLNVRLNVH